MPRGWGQTLLDTLVSTDWTRDQHPQLKHRKFPLNFPQQGLGQMNPRGPFQTQRFWDFVKCKVYLNIPTHTHDPAQQTNFQMIVRHRYTLKSVELRALQSFSSVFLDQLTELFLPALQFQYFRLSLLQKNFTMLC